MAIGTIFLSPYSSDKYIGKVASNGDIRQPFCLGTLHTYEYGNDIEPYAEEDSYEFSAFFSYTDMPAQIAEALINMPDTGNPLDEPILITWSV